MCVNFIDQEKLFDGVSWSLLLRIMKDFERHWYRLEGYYK